MFSRLLKTKKKKEENVISDGSKDLLEEQILNLQVAQEALIYKLQSRKVYDPEMHTCPNIDFSEEPLIKYKDGVFVEDLTTDQQTRLGLSIFHARVDETIESDIHDHKDRYQVVFVRKGKVVDTTNGNKEYIAGDMFCVEKNVKHSVKYFKETEIIFMSIPGYRIVK